MISSHRVMLELLDSHSDSSYQYTGDSEALSPIELAQIYLTSAILVSSMEFIKEQLWLKNKEDKSLGQSTSYDKLLKPFFASELSSISFLNDFVTDASSKKIARISKDSSIIEQGIIALIVKRSDSEQKVFVQQALQDMTDVFMEEESWQEGRGLEEGHRGPRFYRTFDRLDEIFKLNYNLDRDMVVDHETEERLYQGSGVGVQSGYSSILLALENLGLKEGAQVVDLGSGFGRVGLVCSMLRPDLAFTGYEYVPHRVDVSNRATAALRLEDSLIFKTQDLSLKSFNIPSADVFYLYDPFSKETYDYVLEQIVEVSLSKRIAIVTKGNASAWLDNIASNHSWPAPIILDKGNVCIYWTA